MGVIIVKQWGIPKSYGKQYEESNSVLRITRGSSAHRQIDRNLSDSQFWSFVQNFWKESVLHTGIELQKTEDQEDPRLTGKTNVFNSTYNDDQKSQVYMSTPMSVHSHRPFDHYFQSLCLLVVYVSENIQRSCRDRSPWVYLCDPRSGPHCSSRGWVDLKLKVYLTPGRLDSGTGTPLLHPLPTNFTCGDEKVFRNLKKKTETGLKTRYGPVKNCGTPPKTPV
jgi:hypothetical protein